MNAKHLMRTCYLASLAVAIGSVGSWSTGYLSSSGLNKYSLLIVMSCGVAALMIWWWSHAKSLVLITTASASAFFCLAVAIFGIYDSVYRPYSDAGDLWIAYVGWAAPLVLLGSTTLAVSSALLLRHVRTQAERDLKWLAFIGPMSIAPIAAIIIWVASAIEEEQEPWLPPPTHDSIPANSFKIASGTSAEAIWSVWVFGRKSSESCYGIRTRSTPGEEGAADSREEAYCDLGVPPRYWQVVAEGAVGNGDRESITVFITRQDVHELALLAQREQGGSDRVRDHVQARVLTVQRARQAGLEVSVGYAVARVPRGRCVLQVEALGRAGRRLAKGPLMPCWEPSRR